MGELIINEDGTHTVKGGFSTKNKGDMEQVAGLVFKAKPVVLEKKILPEVDPKALLDPAGDIDDLVAEAESENDSEVVLAKFGDKLVDKPKRKRGTRKKKTE